MKNLLKSLVLFLVLTILGAFLFTETRVNCTQTAIVQNVHQILSDSIIVTFESGIKAEVNGTNLKVGDEVCYLADIVIISATERFSKVSKKDKLMVRTISDTE